MTGLRTDSGRLAELSAKQEAIVAERAGHESRVDEIGTDLSDDWSGQSAAAFGQALDNYRAAATALRKEDTAIAQNLARAAALYEAADNEQAGGLSSQMNL